MTAVGVAGVGIEALQGGKKETKESRPEEPRKRMVGEAMEERKKNDGRAETNVDGMAAGTAEEKRWNSKLERSRRSQVVQNRVEQSAMRFPTLSTTGNTSPEKYPIKWQIGG